MNNNMFYKKISEEAKCNPNKLAFAYLEDLKIVEEYTYDELLNIINYYIKNFSFLNLQNKICILYLPASVDSVAIIIASLTIGIIPIIKTIGKNVSRNKINLQLRELKKEIPNIFAVITNYEYADFSKDVIINDINYINTKELENLTAFESTNKNIDADMILLTSGSTKPSKGIKITLEQLEKNIIYCTNIWHIDTNSKGLTWMPHSHIYGILTGIFIPIYTKSTSYIMNPIEFSKKIINYLLYLSNYKITHTHGAASNFTLEKCVSEHKKRSNVKLDLTNLKTFSLGGEAVNIRLLRDFEKYFAKYGIDELVFSPNYGMSEIAGLLCGIENNEKIYTLQVDKKRLQLENIVDFNITYQNCTLISVGKINKKDVLIVSADGLILSEENMIGEIFLSVPSLSNGYLNKEDNIAFVNINIKGESRRFYKTGDIGFIENDYLFVTGRIKDIIKINGKNISPYEIENIINLDIKNNIIGISVAFGVKDKGGREKLVIFLEVHSDYSDEFDIEIKNKVKNVLKAKLQLNINKNDVVIFYNSIIPRLPNGKVSRKLCADCYVGDVDL